MDESYNVEQKKLNTSEVLDPITSSSKTMKTVMLVHAWSNYKERQEGVISIKVKRMIFFERRETVLGEAPRGYPGCWQNSIY